MKKILLSVGLLGLLLTNTYANSCGKSEEGQKPCAISSGTKAPCAMKKDAKFIIHVIGELKLGDEQEIKIRDLITKYQKAKKEFMAKYKDENNLATYFSANGFNQDEFVKNHLKHKEEMLKVDASFYTDVMATLDEKQKEHFLKELQK